MMEIPLAKAGREGESDLAEGLSSLEHEGFLCARSRFGMDDGCRPEGATFEVVITLCCRRRGRFEGVGEGLTLVAVDPVQLREEVLGSRQEAPSLQVIPSLRKEVSSFVKLVHLERELGLEEARF